MRRKISAIILWCVLDRLPVEPACMDTWMLFKQSSSHYGVFLYDVMPYQSKKSILWRLKTLWIPATYKGVSTGKIESHTSIKGKRGVFSNIGFNVNTPDGQERYFIYLKNYFQVVGIILV